MPGTTAISTSDPAVQAGHTVCLLSPEAGEAPLSVHLPGCRGRGGETGLRRRDWAEGPSPTSRVKDRHHPATHPSLSLPSLAHGFTANRMAPGLSRASERGERSLRTGLQAAPCHHRDRCSGRGVVQKPARWFSGFEFTSQNVSH